MEGRWSLQEWDRTGATIGEKVRRSSLSLLRGYRDVLVKGSTFPLGGKRWVGAGRRMGMHGLLLRGKVLCDDK